MPVRLEHIQQPTDADWQDISKIHQETAANGLCDSPEQLKQKLQQGSWVIGGRFNDRIIGLMVATETEQGVQLEQAAVRAITQRRGVIHQLLHHLQKWAQEEEKVLYFRNVNSEFQAPLSSRGFVNKDDIWTYN